MSCDGCTRRTLLHTLALGTAGVLAGCGNDSAAPDGDPGDGGADAPASPISMCGSNLCIDISKVPALQNVNGNMVVPVKVPKTDKIMVLRQTTTTFDTLSAICTHAGCTVAYSVSAVKFNCFCHGSQFALDGSVLRPPAGRALKVYANTFDAQTQLLTITLA